ncbi:MAG: hypothetical protein ACK5L5_01200 [Bacteroidales bacterium]
MGSNKRRIKHLKLRFVLLYTKLKKIVLRLYRTNKSKKVAFTICFIVATFAWLLNALNKTSSYTVVFNVNYTSVPKEMGISTETPKQIHAELSGSGYRLFFLMLGINNNIDISLSRFLSKNKLPSKTGNIINLDIPKHLLFEMFGRRLGSDMSINRLYPESLNVCLDSIISKEIPIKPSVDVTFKNKFNSYGDAFTVPETVSIRGLKTQLDSINIAKTEHQKYEGLSQTTERLIKLSHIDNVELSERVVKVIIPVKEYTENSLKVEIKVRDVPIGRKVVIFPTKAEIKFKASVDDIANIKDTDFEASVNFSQLGIMKSVPINLKVNNANLNSVQLLTTHVNYMIKEN